MTDLSHSPPTTSAPTTSAPSEALLACRHVTQLRRGRPVIQGIDLDLPAKSITVLLGANGAGKSTLLMTLAGELPAASGVVRVGKHVMSESPDEARALLVHVPQRPPLNLELSLREHLETMCAVRGLKRAQMTAQLEAAATRLGLDKAVDRPTGALSGGMQQKAALCIGLLAETSVMLLDEPYTGLDMSSAAALKGLLKERRDRGSCVLLATHLADTTLALADRVLILSAGRIVAAWEASDLERWRDDSGAFERAVIDVMGQGDVAGQEAR